MRPSAEAAIVAVSAGVRDDLVGSFGLPEELVDVLRNPVQVDEIRAAARAAVEHPFFEGGGFVLVAAGRLVRLKGLHVLIDALSRLSRDLGARLVVVGDGPERRALERQVAGAGLGDVVAFVGYDANPWRHLRRADVCVLPSLTEALPTVAAEALALGVPTVASDCSPGMRDYVADGVSGLLVPPDDAEALARALERILRDDELRARLADGARVRGSALPGAEQVRRYEELVLRTLPAETAPT